MTYFFNFRYKYAVESLILFFLVLCINGYSQERLTSRFTYFPNDPQCFQWPVFNWQHKIVTSNREVLNYAVDQHLFYKYTPDFKGLKGNAEVFIYKYSSSEKFDKRVLVEVFHANKIDTLYLDFSAQKDGWVKIGKYNFTGEGKEFIQCTRLSATKNGIITPILPIRFDLYYNTHTRPVSQKENFSNTTIGLSKIGDWKPFRSSGYRHENDSYLSTENKNVAIWNPGIAINGRLNIYVFKPNIKAKDIYSIVHNGMVDQIQLENLVYANLDLFNPVTAQGWFKMGEFDFAGNGKEYIQLTKTNNDTSRIDCIMLEQVYLDGTLLDRTIITTKEYNGILPNQNSLISLEEKIQKTKKVVGLSPNNNGESIVTSSKNGSTIYSRAIYSKETNPKFIWNPCILDSGKYNLYYYVYYLPNTGGSFVFHSKGIVDSVSILLKNLVAQQHYLVGSFNFKGGDLDEYIEMKQINRASDICLEKQLADGAILKQRIVTAHPYFLNFNFNDTKGTLYEHDVSELVRRKIVKPFNKNIFGNNLQVSFSEFMEMLKVALDSSQIQYSDFPLLYSFNPLQLKQGSINLEEAAQILFNAMELSGKYSNVRNYFRQPITKTLLHFKDLSNIKYSEALAKLIEIYVIKSNAKDSINPFQKLTKLKAGLLVKEFMEQVLSSGPPLKADFDISFYDEFEGNNIDWNKWFADDAVRFKNISAKWKENCVVEDGLFKGYNYMDNHIVPYSSGNLNSNFRQTYGFFEARYKYPERAYGSHSSFWTSSKGGDFNYNEGAYPNSVSNNNYFMKSGTNFHDFATNTNLSHDFHTYSGYLNKKDLYYGMDGKISWEVIDYAKYISDKKDPNWPFEKTTNFPYNAMMSTVVTYFDGPLDRDRIDGSFMACDWVRIYKEIHWLPDVDSIYSIKDMQTGKSKKWMIKFNKPMDKNSITNTSISIQDDKGSKIPYNINYINPIRYLLEVEMTNASSLKLLIQSSIKDTRGNSIKSTSFHLHKNSKSQKIN